MFDQVLLPSNHLSMAPTRSTCDHIDRDWKQASSEDHRWKATRSLTRSPTRLLVGRPGRELIRAAQRPIVLNERARHVYCTTTVGRPRHVRLQLAGTESSWQGRVVVVIAALQVSET